APIGVAKGINPGRVVWMHAPQAVEWDGKNGKWWSETNLHQKDVTNAFNQSIMSLTSESTIFASWNALFKYHNSIHGIGNTGYAKGEKIAIKINCNQDKDLPNWTNNNALPTPQLLYTIVKQLVEDMGVNPADITIYDASRYIGDPLYNKVTNGYPHVNFVVKPEYAKKGRKAAQKSLNNIVHFADKRIPAKIKTYIPKCAAQAKYMINLALFRGHNLAGITSSSKNHYGSVWNGSEWKPNHLHQNVDINKNSMGTPSTLVDLEGHKNLGGKTLLYVIDAFYGNYRQNWEIVRFQSFGNDWCSSIFTSQDVVALESVVMDFLRNEPYIRNNFYTNSVDNHLHEAAQANNPPSGVKYDPENDGSRLQSLGVHEHWNNFQNKQYSRNLGLGNGIELISLKGSGVNQKPIVQFAHPQNNDVLKEGANLDVTVYASDPEGKMGNVELFINNTALGASLTAPYRWFAIDHTQLSNLAKGTYTLKAIASDAQGVLTTKQINFSVGGGSSSGKQIPGILQFEKFDAQKGVTISGNTIINIHKGDWTDFKVYVTQAGTYSMCVRVNKKFKKNSKILLKQGGATLGKLTVNSASNQWKTICINNVQLKKGSQTLRFAYAGKKNKNL
ncbi:MAG: DUF362 domain-containing protein, partial [Bacteroidales bacterium]|nr:DUF362 domain-containing protein [Bacteroidales bacterium]